MRIPTFALSILLSLIAHGAAAASLSAAEQTNRELVMSFTKAMQERNVPLAASFLDDAYIQHNPLVPGGKDGFAKFFSALWKDGPRPKADRMPDPPVLVVVQDDHVMLVFRRPLPEPADPTKTYDSFWFDAYRVADGKIVEHWDPLTKPPVGKAPTPAE